MTLRFCTQRILSSDNVLLEEIKINLTVPFLACTLRVFVSVHHHQSANQEGTEDMVCGFIHNLVTNSYDEYGEIYLKGESWTEYLPHMEEMSKWQKYLLSSMVLGCVCLSFVAGYLHRKITQRRLVWLPRTKKGYSSNDPGHSYQLNERGNSGIIQGRSQSSNFEMKDGGVMS